MTYRLITWLLIVLAALAAGAVGVALNLLGASPWGGVIGLLGGYAGGFYVVYRRWRP